MTTKNSIPILESILEEMLKEDRTISARSIIKEVGCPHKHASDITRQPNRKALMDTFIERQRLLRAVLEKTDSQ